MQRSWNYILMITLLAMLLAVGCASGKRVSRVAADKQVDLSGRWNDTDSQQVGTAIVTDCLSQPWLEVYKSEHNGKRPVVIVGTVVNKSHEHINVETFIKDIERALINSQKVRFVSSRSERGEIRQERSDQHQGYTDESTRAGVGQEVGADFMLKGSLNSIPDEIDSHKVMYYQTDLELHNLTTNEVVWIGQHKIKKIIDRDSVRW